MPINQSHPVRALLLYVIALLLFAYMDSATKYVATLYPVPMIVAIRYLVHFALMAVLLGPSQGRRLVQVNRTGLVVLRAACLAVTSLFVALALQRMPVAETTAICFLAPMVVVMAAGRLLGETIRPLDWFAVATGFIGVLLIVRPGGGLDPIGIVFTLVAVASNAGYQLLSRVLAGSESTIALLFHTALLGSIVFGAVLPWTWGGPTPTTLQLILLLSLGVSGGLGHWLFTAAYRSAPASLLAPMTYLQLLWAGLLGWIAFGHVPDGISSLGMAVVAVSGVMVAMRVRRAAVPQRAELST